MCNDRELLEIAEDELYEEKKKKAVQLIKNKCRELDRIKKQIKELEDKRQAVLDDLYVMDNMVVDEVIEKYGEPYSGVVNITLNGSYDFINANNFTLNHS